MNLKDQKFLKNFKKFVNKKIQEKNEQKELTFNNAIRFLKGREKFFNGFERYFRYKNRQKEESALWT